MTEEGRHLVRGGAEAEVDAGGLAKPRMDRKAASVKGFLVTLLTALAVYLVAAAVSRAIIWDGVLPSETVLEDGSTSSPLDGTAPSTLVGLVNPNNGSRPSLTTTSDCTADTGLPVLAGVDVVAYWTLPGGASPILGSHNLMSMFQGYRFFFSSIENLRTFESDPLTYLPAWGGFCSYGVADEDFWTPETLGPFSNPSKWIIGSDGKLHVFRSRLPMIKFLMAPDEYIEAGNANWNSWFPEEDGMPPLNTACFCSDGMCTDA
ncbi:unnamed protein product [Scytosiphon promiscuus]